MSIQISRRALAPVQSLEIRWNALASGSTGASALRLMKSADRDEVVVVQQNVDEVFSRSQDRIGGGLRGIGKQAAGLSESFTRRE